MFHNLFHKDSNAGISGVFGLVASSDTMVTRAAAATTEAATSHEGPPGAGYDIQHCGLYRPSAYVVD